MSAPARSRWLRSSSAKPAARPHRWPARCPNSSPSTAALPWPLPETPAHSIWPVRSAARWWESMDPPTPAATGLLARASSSCAARKAAATTPAARRLSPAFLLSSLATSCAPPPHCYILNHPHAHPRRFATRLDLPLAAHRPAYSRSAGLPLRSTLSFRTSPAHNPSGRRGLEPGAGSARPLAARLRLRLRQKESRTHRDRPLRLHPQLALPGLYADRRRLCPGAAQLAGSRCARARLCCHLRTGHRLRGALSARHFPRLRRLLPTGSAPDSPAHPGPPAKRPKQHRLFLPVALPPASRVQCRDRGSAALPQPAPAAAVRGRGCESAAISGFRVRAVHSARSHLASENALNPDRRSLRTCPGRRGPRDSRPAGDLARAASPRLQLSAQADPHLLGGLASFFSRNSRAAL